LITTLVDCVELSREEHEQLKRAVVQLVRHAPALLLAGSDRVSHVLREPLLTLVLERYIPEHHLGAAACALRGQRGRADCLNPNGRRSRRGMELPRTAVRGTREEVPGEMGAEDVREQKAADVFEIPIEESPRGGVRLVDQTAVVDDQDGVRRVVVQRPVSTLRRKPCGLAGLGFLPGATLLERSGARDRS